MRVAKIIAIGFSIDFTLDDTLGVRGQQGPARPDADRADLQQTWLVPGVGSGTEDEVHFDCGDAMIRDWPHRIRCGSRRNQDAKTWSSPVRDDIAHHTFSLGAGASRED